MEVLWSINNNYPKSTVLEIITLFICKFIYVFYPSIYLSEAGFVQSYPMWVPVFVVVLCCDT